ncbi:MAG TPA: MJ1255/VC2487 family glycosyltransferase [Polyangiaceae bacterium]|nr:MJ1255/VC2487 family glycosyltransferase [Polyangiaceae bacterium]
MKILYGVVGEGMGHAMRSRVVLEHLTAAGHEVETMASQRAVDYLRARFAEVHRIHGLHIIYEENRVRRGKTLLSNVAQGAQAIPRQIRAYFDLVQDFRPQIVISDFESWTYLYGKTHGVPVISLDNIQMINRCFHDRAIIDNDRTGFELARAFVKSKLPLADQYLITSFYYPPIRKPRTSLYPPILRPEILSAVPRRGDHLLVYQTAEGNDALIAALAASRLECRIYGMRRAIKEDEVEGNLRFRPFSEAGFIEDLATARGVVAGGGFTLMSECVYLHKPMLSMPVGGQFEQTLNALYLEREGYGKHARTLDAATLSAFLDAIPGCEERLAAYSQDGNRRLLAALDGMLDRRAAGLDVR